MSKKYWVLSVQWDEGDLWSPEFSDWDRRVVVQELDDMRSTYEGEVFAWDVSSIDKPTKKAGQELTDRLNHREEE